MGGQQNYKARLRLLLHDRNICAANKKLFKEFFSYEEIKLKRMNGISKVDDSSYKTLTAYIGMFYNVNRWFNNKAWKDLTKKDIEKVYNDICDGKILNRQGKPYADRKKYFNCIFKSKPFRIAGKSELAKDVIIFPEKRKKDDVAFIDEDSFRKLPLVAINVLHKVLLWCAFDYGENINALLLLTKHDFTRQINENGDPEYVVNLRSDILKRSRTSRTEISNYPETVEFLDIVLSNLKDNELVFPFKYGMARKVLARAARITKVKTIPKGDGVTWKVLRNSMACDLMNKGWSKDEVNSRLGHNPSSTEIDKYWNFLAMDKKVPKKKMCDHSLGALKDDLNKSKDREKLQSRKLDNVKDEVKDLRNTVFGLLERLSELDPAVKAEKERDGGFKLFKVEILDKKK